MELLKRAHEAGVDLDELAEIAKTEYNWTSWRNQMWHLIDQMEN